MISRFHTSLFNKEVKKETTAKTKALINFIKAEKEIREMFKRSLELNMENKRMSITSGNRSSIGEMDKTMLDDDELDKPVTLALNSIMDKHGRVDQTKL